MGRDTIVSWQTFALFLLVPPLAVLAVVFFPITLLVVFYMYYKGREKARMAERNRPSSPE